MTTASIPTTGEFAQRAVGAFTELVGADLLETPSESPRVRKAAVEFVRATLGLVRKMPMSARVEFGTLLPFSRLELRLLDDGRLDDEEIADAVASRLVEWVNRSPVFVDEASVHVADFLVRLTPYLDLWAEREVATATIERMSRL